MADAETTELQGDGADCGDWTGKKKEAGVGGGSSGAELLRRR